MMKSFAIRKKKIVNKGGTIRGKKISPKFEFSYVTANGRKIVDKKVLKHLTSLRVPPAYDDVKINLDKGEKLFAYGIDEAGRPQYIYNQKHVVKQMKRKYCKLIKFDKKLPMINDRIDKLVKQKKWNVNKIVAIILRIILHCNFRVGNDIYRKKYNSFGITTVTRNHLTFNNNGTVRIKFIGKKGVENDCTVRDKGLVSAMKRIDKNNRSNGNKGDEPYFTYNDDKTGALKVVKAKDVNDFLGKFGDFTSKDYRTWAANVALLGELCKHVGKNGKNIGGSVNARKKELKEIIEGVAVRLHHTPAICKKSYIDNDILDMYVERPNDFRKMIKGCNGSGECVNKVFVGFLRSKC